MNPLQAIAPAWREQTIAERIAQFKAKYIDIPDSIQEFKRTSFVKPLVSAVKGGAYRCLGTRNRLFSIDTANLLLYLLMHEAHALLWGNMLSAEQGLRAINLLW